MNFFSYFVSTKARAAVIRFTVFFFILIILIRNLYFINIEKGPQNSDNQLYHSFTYYRALFLGETFELGMQTYPPFVYCITQIFYYFLGSTCETSRISLLLFLVIFLLAMFGIGYELGGYFSGFSVMAISASCPYILDYSVRYYLDFPLTALIALSIYFLIKADYFRKQTYSILSGILIAIALLTKQPALYYIFFPLLWCIIPNIIKSRKTMKLSLFLFFPLAAMIIGTVLFISKLFYVGESRFYCYHQEYWIIAYLIFIVVPSVVLSVIAYYKEKNLQVPDDDDYAAFLGIINFAYSLSIIVTVTMVWYYGAMIGQLNYIVSQQFVRDEWLKYAGSNINAYKITLLHIYQMLINSYNFSAIYLISGIVFLFVRPKVFSQFLFMFFSFIASSLIIVLSFHQEFRILLPLTIYIIAMGGYWIGYTGRFRIFITTIVILSSMLSILSWIPIPPNQVFFKYYRNYPLKSNWITSPKILYPKPPSVNTVYTDEVFEYLFSGISGRKITIFLISTNSHLIDYIYYLQGESLKNRNIIHIYRHKTISYRMIHSLSQRTDIDKEKADIEHNTEFVITLYKYSWEKEKVEEIHNCYFPDRKLESRDFMIAENFNRIWIKVSKVKE